MELLRIISAHLARNDVSSPIMLDLPSSYFLDHIISHPPGTIPGRSVSPVLNRSSLCLSSLAEQPMSACSPVHPLTHPGRLSHLFWNNPTLRRAIQLAGSHSHGKRSRPASVITHSTLLSVERVKTAVPQVCPPNTKDMLRRSLSTSSVSKRPAQSAPDDKPSSAAHEA